MAAELSTLNLSLYPLVGGFGLRDTYKEGCGKYLAMLPAEACFIFGTVIGVIETVFWGAIFLLAKTIHLFIPDSYETPKAICNWIYSMLGSSARITFGSGVFAIANFCMDEMD